MIVQIILIQSFTSFRWNIAEIFDFENGPFSSPYKRNGSWKCRKIVRTGFCDVIIGELRIQQPRSQGLSSLPPLLVERKTLVAAGHVTTQNLGGKKICWIRGVTEYFVCWFDKLCGFQIMITWESLKTTRSVGVRSRIFQWRMLHDFCHF